MVVVLVVVVLRVSSSGSGRSSRIVVWNNNSSSIKSLLQIQLFIWPHSAAVTHFEYDVQTLRSKKINKEKIQ
jgi:hypothetical protein